MCFKTNPSKRERERERERGKERERERLGTQVLILPIMERKTFDVNWTHIIMMNSEPFK